MKSLPEQSDLQSENDPNVAVLKVILWLERAGVIPHLGNQRGYKGDIEIKWGGGTTEKQVARRLKKL
jgi:hypothetical protein